MALENFLDTNLPFGMQKVEGNKWIIYNREYQPIGTNPKVRKAIFIEAEENEELGVIIEYPNLTSEKLIKIIDNNELIWFDENGEVRQAHFYQSSINNEIPKNTYNDYFDRLKKLCEEPVKNTYDR